MKTVTVIPGDGVGAEVTSAAIQCVDALECGIEWEIVEVKNGKLGAAISSVQTNKVGLKGPITTPVGRGYRSLNVGLRKELGLYAGVRPVKGYQGLHAPFPEVDLVVVRENTEDLYAGLEFQKGSKEQKGLRAFLHKQGMEVVADSGISLKTNSVAASKRIAAFALRYAQNIGRSKITIGHKANILKYSDGLFLGSAREALGKQKKIKVEDKIIDTLCMQLVQDPMQFDVLLLPNLYGDIVSDLAAGLVGGLGVAPGANFGDQHALFEAVHGTAPDIAGKNVVNPAAMILSAGMMLHHMGMEKEAIALEHAVASTLQEGHHLTRDLEPREPSVGTKEMTREIVRKIQDRERHPFGGE